MNFNFPTNIQDFSTRQYYCFFKYKIQVATSLDSGSNPNKFLSLKKETFRMIISYYFSVFESPEDVTLHSRRSF